MSTNWILEADGIGHDFGPRTVLADISLRLPAGSFCAILGPNGRGKSTLLKILAGQLSPVRGRVTRADRVGFVPQEVQPALSLSVREMVLLGRAARIGLFATPDAGDHAAVLAALQRVEADALIDRRFESLSGGERQLVLMARALVSGARLLLLDEPTAALDWHRQALILRLLADLVAQGLTVVMSTHAPQHALDFASHVLLMPGTGPACFGPPAQVMDEPALAALYGLPVAQVPVPALPSGRAIVPLLHADAAAFASVRPAGQASTIGSPHVHPAPSPDLP